MKSKKDNIWHFIIFPIICIVPWIFMLNANKKDVPFKPNIELGPKTNKPAPPKATSAQDALKKAQERNSGKTRRSAPPILK